jgi:CheY-like chemotaxis protein
MRVLIVEDEPIIGRASAMVLGRLGHEVVHVSRSAEAQAQLQAGDWDMAFVDVVLPDADGVELTRGIVEASPQTTVVIISGLATPVTVTRAIRAGAYDFLAKPFDRDELAYVAGRAQRRTELLRADGMPPPCHRTERRVFGEHAWFLLEDSGHARVGVCHRFIATIQHLHGIDLVPEGAALQAGSPLAWISDHSLGVEVARRSDGAAPRVTVLSGIAGLVAEVNPAIRDDPSLVADDPLDAGWLYRVDPAPYDPDTNFLVAP